MSKLKGNIPWHLENTPNDFDYKLKKESKALIH